MKNKLPRLPKWLRLTIHLLLIALMAVCLWHEADGPRLSPQGALREAERRSLLDFVFEDVHMSALHYFTAVSRSETQLHTAEITRRRLLWQPNERAVAIPLGETLTTTLLPWQVNIESDERSYPAALVYCPDAERVTGTLTINGTTFSGRAGRGANGCWLLAFESLYDLEDESFLTAFRDYAAYVRIHSPLKHEIELQITAYDPTGQVIAEKTRTYS